MRTEFKKGKNKHDQKINRTGALSMFRDISTGLILKNKMNEALSTFDQIVNTREIVRPGRKFVRKKRPKKL